MSEQELAKLEEVERCLKKVIARQNSTISRVWDNATKLAVPIVLALAGWAMMIDREVHKHSLEITRLDIEVERRPPEWLREIVAELKDTTSAILQRQTDILQRLSSLEARITQTPPPK